MKLNRKLRYGMVGGGPGAFIGQVHRMAAALDGKMELVAGVFSSDPQKSKEMGHQLNMGEERVYKSFHEMAEQESRLPAEKQIDFVSVVTPNHLHFEVCKAFIEVGINIICDKPMTNTIEEAEELCRLVKKRDVIFALTHNYTGYPMVKEARHLVEQGKFGKLQKIVVEYPQDGFIGMNKDEIKKKWRVDPAKTGVSTTVADIGSHTENLVNYITGLKMERLVADISTFTEGMTLEDDANMLVHYEQGVRCVLYASKISAGENNPLKFRIYGTKAGLEWNQEIPERLEIKYPDCPDETCQRGESYLSEVAQFNSRIPSGHPEGFIEAFANIYRNVGLTIRDTKQGKTPSPLHNDFPTVQDGARGVHFIHKAIESGKKEAWVDMEYEPPES